MSDIVYEYPDKVCRRVLHQLMYLRHLQTMLAIPLQLTLPAYKMSRWHLLHYAPKVEGVGIVSNDLLAGLRLLVVYGSDGRHIYLMVTMKHDTWSTNDVVLVQLVQVLFFSSDTVR